LPRLENVIFMAGFKFGAQAEPSRTWAMNCYVPALVGRHFTGSRIAAFSTGNVYGLVPCDGGGSREDDPLQPVGEYAMTALGRERMFEYFSRRHGFPLALLRLNYASELRYGVLVDLARKVLQGRTIDISMAHVNVIWQGDANAAALQSLAMADQPPCVLNIAGPETLRIVDVCRQFGKLLDREPRFSGQEQPDALLSNSQRCRQQFGEPEISADQLIRWTAEWVGRGGESLDKPTHFESRDGGF
jgi:nucleoside-diphosphate-sugar epimerase